VHNNPLTNVDPSGHWCESTDGKWAHPGNCADGTIQEPDYMHDGDRLIRNGNEVGTFYDNNDSVHEDNSWAGVLFDTVITGGFGLGKVAVSKTITKLFGRAVAEEAATAAKGMIFYGGLAGEAFLADLVGATAKNQLQQSFSTTMGRRVVDVLVDEMAYESKAGYLKYSQVAVKQIQKDAELIAAGDIKGAVWHFFKSGYTGVGADQRLLDLLTQNGMKYVIHK